MPLRSCLSNAINNLVDAASIDEIIAPFWRTDDGRSAEERAEAYGIDLSLITENLRLRPEQRMLQNDFSLTEAEQLIAAHERSHPHYPATL